MCRVVTGLFWDYNRRGGENAQCDNGNTSARRKCRNGVWHKRAYWNGRCVRSKSGYDQSLDLFPLHVFFELEPAYDPADRMTCGLRSTTQQSRSVRSGESNCVPVTFDSLLYCLREVYPHDHAQWWHPYAMHKDWIGQALGESIGLATTDRPVEE